MAKSKLQRIIFSVIISLVIGSLIALGGLLIYEPTYLKIIRYQAPNAETYLAFPQAIVKASDTPFYFIKSEHQSTSLDTLKVWDAGHELIPLSAYLEKGKINAFLVIRNDSILYEKYRNGYNKHTLVTTFSVAKSMLSIMVGQALAEGKFRSLNDPLVKYIPELNTNPAFRGVTLMHLLSMKSGLYFKDIKREVINDFFSDEAKYYYTSAIKKNLIKIKSQHKPGLVWQYKSVDPLLLGWALENATGKSIASFFEEKLWRRIGTEDNASWGLDHQNGLANTASRFQTSAIDFAKIGRLMLQQGKYRKAQIVPQDWVQRSVSKDISAPVGMKGWQKSAHHYLWWVPQEGINGDYAAEGMRGQRLYIDPLTNTIIVQFADHGAGDYPYRKISRFLSGMPFQYPK